MLKDIVFFTNHQKIIEFLLANPEEEYYDRQISKLAGVSRAGANFALRNLLKENILTRSIKGRMNFYRINSKNPVIKHLKIVQNILKLENLINKLKIFSRKIILYGSSAKGENTRDSDFDVFILSNDKKSIESVLYKSPLREKLQAVILSQNEFMKLKRNNPVFNKQILDGIIIWENHEY